MNRIMQTFQGEFKTLDRSNMQLRKFGFVVGGILATFWAISFVLFDSPIHGVVGAIGAALVISGALFPRVLLWPYYFWMGIAIVLGFFLSQIVLGLLYFVCVTPIGLLRRAFEQGKGLPPQTYWIKREKGWTKETMERLF